MTANITDTSQCPSAEKCYRCEGQVNLEVVSMDTQIGVLCMTICDFCVQRLSHDDPPPLAMDLRSIADAVGRHCQHLGITLHEMACHIAGMQAFSAARLQRAITASLESEFQKNREQ